MAGQPTVSSQDDHLSGQTFRLPGILTDLQVGNQKKKIHFQTTVSQEEKHLFSLYVTAL